MRRKIIGMLVCTLLIVTAISAVGQIKDISISKDEISPLTNSDNWIKIFDNGFEFGYYAQETSDGGFIVGGVNSSSRNDYGNIWLIKTDSAGNLIWEGFYGGESSCSDVQETSDKGYIITGHKNTHDKKWQYTLIKVDSNGEITWENSFGDIHHDCGAKVRELEDGGFITLGFADAYSDYDTQQGYIWLIKTDSNGNILWDKKFGGEGYNIGLSLDITNDNGFIITGLCNNSDETDGYDLWIIKTDGNGEIIWEKKYQNEIYDFGRIDIQKTIDGGYIIVGNINWDSSICEIWLLKIDSNGEILWDKVFSDYAPYQEAYAVRETNDGGFIIAGITGCNGYGSDALIIKTDNQGEEIWVNNKELKGYQYIYSVEQTTDGGYIFTGYLYKDWPFSDIHYLWLIKADSNGNYPTSRARNRVFTNSFLMRLCELFPNAFPLLRHLLGI